MSKRYSTDWITVKGTTAFSPVEQDEQDWFDCSGHDYAEIEVCLAQLTGATLSILGADGDSQYWNYNMTVTSMSPTFQLAFLNRSYPPGDTRCLRDLLRWSISGGASWEATFRIVVNLK